MEWGGGLDTEPSLLTKPYIGHLELELTSHSTVQWFKTILFVSMRVSKNPSCVSLNSLTPFKRFNTTFQLTLAVAGASIVLWEVALHQHH